MHSLPKDLADLKLVNEATVEQYYPRVRDRDDIGVLRDTESGVIFLDRMDHMDLAHYEEMEKGSYWSAEDRTEALKNYREDDLRRGTQFAELVRGKDYVDVGCGTGGILDELKSVAGSVTGVEPQQFVREELERLGYSMFKLPEELPNNSYDVASLFHVLEHITEPLKVLKEVHTALRPGGTVVVEVPHARDALLSLYNLEAFKAFTFWSEHLVLHTRDSLTRFLEAAGYTNIRVEGFQRYPLANHLWWLSKGEPGGQTKLPQLVDPVLNAAYQATLDRNDATDTLIAYGTKA